MSNSFFVQILNSQANLKKQVLRVLFGDSVVFLSNSVQQFSALHKFQHDVQFRWCVYELFHRDDARLKP